VFKYEYLIQLRRCKTLKVSDDDKLCINVLFERAAIVMILCKKLKHNFKYTIIYLKIEFSKFINTKVVVD